MLHPFHLAVPVHSLKEAKRFYGELLQCEEGRSSDHWIDYNFFGHQFVVHLNEGMIPENHSNAVDGHNVPIPHFGVVLEWNDWHALAEHISPKSQICN